MLIVTTFRGTSSSAAKYAGGRSLVPMPDECAVAVLSDHSVKDATCVKAKSGFMPGGKVESNPKRNTSVPMDVPIRAFFDPLKTQNP